MRDLTKGSPLKLIILFALPLGLGQLFQQLYSVVDVRIIGSTLGELPLAAVGATTPLSDFLVGFLNGFCNGFAIVVATAFGRNREREVKQSVAASFVTGAVLALVLTLFSLLGLNNILKLMNVEEDLLPMGVSYIRIIIGGLFFSVLYNTCAAVLRGIGDTVTPLMFLIISSVMNVGFDYFFILVLKQGVEGAAMATVLSQAVSAVLCIIRILKKYPLLHPGVKDFYPDKKLYPVILSTGFSMGMMISLVNLGTLVLQGAINSFSPYIIVGHTSARKASFILMLPNGVFGAALAAFSGQNYGAGKYDRIRKGCFMSILTIFVWDILALILVWIAGRDIISLISASTNEETLYWGSMYLKVDLCFYAFCTMVCCLRNTLQGMGHSVTTIVSSFTELLTKVLIAFFLVPIAGYMGIIWCEPIAWFLMLIPLVVKYYNLVRSRNAEGSQLS